MAHVPPWWHHSERRAQEDTKTPAAEAHRTRTPAAPKRPHRRDPSASVMNPSPDTVMPTSLGTEKNRVPGATVHQSWGFGFRPRCLALRYERAPVFESSRRRVAGDAALLPVGAARH